MSKVITLSFKTVMWILLHIMLVQGVWITYAVAAEGGEMGVIGESITISGNTIRIVGTPTENSDWRERQQLQREINQAEIDRMHEKTIRELEVERLWLLERASAPRVNVYSSLGVRNTIENTQKFESVNTNEVRV